MIWVIKSIHCAIDIITTEESFIFRSSQMP